MTRPASSRRLLRAVIAVAVACSWLLMAGLPAGAVVTGSTVESPKSGATLKKPKPLVVAVDRALTPDKNIQVRTRLFYGGTPAPPPQPEPSEEPSPSGDDQMQQQEQEEDPARLKPVSKKELLLRRIGKPEATTAGQRFRFGGALDPYRLAWLPQVGTGRNGQYTLEYQVTTDEEAEEWRRFEFRLDAAPPPQGAPGVGVQDAAAKRVIVAWRANTAPDITSYVIERRLGTGPWKIAEDEVKPRQTQITDTVAKYGTYQYRVTAARPAGDGSKDLRTTTSLPSAPLALQAAARPAPADPGGDNGAGSPPTVTDDSDPSTGSGSDSTGTGSGTGSGVPSSSGVPSTSNGFGTQTDESAQEPGVAPPPGFDDTFQGPLDYNVQQDEVTERVPVDVAQGGTTEDGGTLTVLNRAVDQERVLPPLAGGLILVLSAAHVLRYLNE